MSFYTKEQLEKYADILIWGLRTARPGFMPHDNVLLRCSLPGRELGEIIYRKLIQQKFNVIFRFLATPENEKSFYSYSDEEQLAFMPPGDKEMYEGLNGNILVYAPESLTHLKDVDTKRQSIAMLARKPVREIMNRREDNGEFGWTLCTYPTEELARQAGLSIQEYADQIAKACLLNEADPVKKWTEIFENTKEIKQWLLNLGIDTIHVESEHVDLEVKLGEKRRFKGISGHNIPSFEIFTSPDWRYTKGVYFANLPAFRGGNLVENIRLEFRDGRAVGISAEKGDDYVKKILATDEGACQVGEFSLTDKRFSKIDKFMADTLFDENHGGQNGNCHIAVGSAYADTYDGDVRTLTAETKKELGFNDSAVHWDMINTEKKIVTAVLKNGKKVTIYEDGMFRM